VSEATPTVFLVDDDVSYLRAIARLLRLNGFNIVIHNSAAEFLASLKPDTAGCVVTDLRMPGMDGMELQEALQRTGHALTVLFLTGHGDIPATVRAMRGGAEDFLTKHTPKPQLITAINKALARCEREQAERRRLRTLRQLFELLSNREAEVLRLVVQGRLNKQIAAELGIRERTVKFHRTSITAKLQVHSVAEIARMAQEAGFR
jgi:FixJ family two-component response regulator